MSPQGKARSLLALAAVGACAALVLTVTATLMAVLGGNLDCLGGATAAAQPVTPTAAREIPPERLALYRAAGARFDIDWTFVASIGTQECGTGTCAHVYPSGCGGPMQIALVPESACSPGPGPTIWDTYKVDGDGDGRAEPFDLADAIFTAARIMRLVMHAPPAGGSWAGYRRAACNYYGVCADSLVDYAEEVMRRAVSYGFRGPGTPSATPAATETVAEGQGGQCTARTGGASANAIVRIAESRLGTAESPPGSNCTPYGPCEEWCSLFVAWVWEQAGVPLRGGTAPYAYSGSIYEWARDHEAGSLPGETAPGESPFSRAEPDGARVLAPTATPAPGDAVLFGSGPGDSAHTAIVERVFPDGEIVTIDGNYADRVARVGPFLPSRAVQAGEPAPVYGYAQPPSLGDGEGVGGHA